MPIQSLFRAIKHDSITFMNPANMELSDVVYDQLVGAVKHEVSSVLRGILTGLVNMAVLGADRERQVSNILNGSLSDISDLKFSSLFEDISLRSFAFKVNPAKVQISKSKLNSTVLTGAGWKTNYWGRGNAMVDFAYSGAFVNLVPLPIFAKLGIRDPRLSRNWINLALFQRFYEGANSDLIMVYDEEAWLGVLNDFKYTIDADNPWAIQYSFRFSAYPDSNVNLLSGVGDFFTDYTEFMDRCSSLFPEALPSEVIVETAGVGGEASI